MQNYFISLFTPLPHPGHLPSAQKKSRLGLDTTYLPRLSCVQRLALDATKTENTSKMPVLPRPRFQTSFFQNNYLALDIGLQFLPPIPLPAMTASYLAADLSVAYEPLRGIGVVGRTFMGLLYLRSEIATPFSKDDPVKEDWFTFASFGADITFSMAMPISARQTLVPFVSAGFIKAASLFVVADDRLPVPNEKYPLFSPTIYSGFAYQVFDEQLNINFTMGGALNAVMTGHIGLSYGF